MIVLSHEVDIVVVFVDLIEAYNVRVVEGHRYLQFVHESLDILDVGFGYFFDGSPWVITTFHPPPVYSSKGSSS